MEYISSDKGTQFTSNIFRDLTKLYNIHHHISSTEVHHNNGAIEVANKLIKSTMKAILSELKLTSKDWQKTLPIIQYSINNRKSRILNNLAPITVMMGIPPGNLLPTVISQPNKISIVEYTKLIKSNIDQLLTKLEDIHQIILKQKNNNISKMNLNKQKIKNISSINFKPGDYVLMAKPEREITNKLIHRWTGPMLVLRKLSNWIYELQNVITNKILQVHIERIDFYHDENLDLTFDLKESIAFNQSEYGYEVNELIDIEKRNDEFWILVDWKGFDIEDRTYQRLDILMEDVPALVKQFFKMNSKNKIVQEAKAFIEERGM